MYLWEPYSAWSDLVSRMAAERKLDFRISSCSPTDEPKAQSGDTSLKPCHTTHQPPYKRTRKVYTSHTHTQAYTIPFIHRTQSYHIYTATLLTHTSSLPIEEAKYRLPFSLDQPHYPGKAQLHPNHLQPEHWATEYKEQTLSGLCS